MTKQKDDFELMDSLQDDLDAAISEMLPFEPCRELCDKTAIEEPTDPEPVEAVPNLPESDSDGDDVVDPLDGLDMPALEGKYE